MNRYMVFGFDTYYPSGGAHDFLSSFEKLEDAQNYIFNQNKFDEYHIYDTETLKIVEEYEE